MARIAIYGSCVTRDAFEVRAHDHEIAGYFARSSMISQASLPVAFTPEQIGERLKRWERKLVLADLEKTVVQQIVALAPDLVIVDLIDERLPLLRAGDSFLTLSSYSRKTPLVRKLARRGKRLKALDPARDFAAAAKHVMTALTEHVPPDRILLHRASYSTRTNGLRRFGPRSRHESKRMNAALDVWHDVVAAASGCREFAPSEDVQVADTRHRWGLSQFHYVPAYYEHLMDEVDRVCASSRPLT